MKKKMKMILLISMIICTFLVISCSGTSVVAETEETTAAEVAETEETTAATGKKIGISMRSVGDAYNLSLLLGARNKITELGYEPIITDANVDPLQQLKDIDNLIIQDIKGLVVQPEDPQAIVPAIEKLNDANIPVASMDVGPLGGKLIAIVNFGQYDSGVSQGEIMESELIKIHGDNLEGVILDIMGDVRHAGLTDERSNGFRSVFEKYEGIEVVSQPGDWLVDKAYTVTTDLLTQYGDRVIGVGTASDDMIAGIVSAIEAQGLFKLKGEEGHIVVTSTDGGPEGLQFVREGKVEGIALQPSKEYGELCALYVIKAHEGEILEFTDGQIIEEEGAIWSPAVVTMTDWGPNIKLNSGKIPGEIDVDDPRLWGNDPELLESLQQK